MLSIVDEIITIKKLRRVIKIFINIGKLSGHIFKKW
jgi:hypothetical protein